MTALRPVERFYEEGPGTWAVTELIEAAVRSGQPQLAGHPFERLVETTRASATDWALGIEAAEVRC